MADYAEATAEARKEITNPIGFMQKNYPRLRLWRYILTHPDLDHMRGINRLYEMARFDNFWDTAHTKSISEFKNEADKEDWSFYQKLQSGGAGLRSLNFERGDQLFAFGRNHDGSLVGDNIETLSPTKKLTKSCNAAGKSNDFSYVLRLWQAGRSVLLPGDIEEEAWNDLVATYWAALKSDFMRASHHGRD
jgi:competence protein ComEC